MILGIQIVGVIFSLTMIYLALINYKKGDIGKLEFLLWFLVWLLVIFVTAFPDFLRSFAMKFFVTRVFDLMVIGGFILVISLVSVSYLKTKKIEKKIENFIRKQTLDQSKKTGK
jgi:hypothetical protein